MSNLLDAEEQQKIEYWLKQAKEEEQALRYFDNDWEKWVAEPVIMHRLAPRQARAALEILGILTDKGISISEILGLLVMIISMAPSGIKGDQAGKDLRKTMEKMENQNES